MSSEGAHFRRGFRRLMALHAYILFATQFVCSSASWRRTAAANIDSLSLSLTLDENENGR